MDELSKFTKLPRFKADTSVEQVEGGISIKWNADFDLLQKFAGPRITFKPDFPVRACLIANRYIASAAQENCDLYVSDRMAAVIGNKLFQLSRSAGKPRDVIESLKTRVTFPNIQKLVNLDRIDFATVLQIRGKSAKFRGWLQNEKERDMDAITAYHYEVAKNAGLLRGAKSTLRLVSTIAGAAIGASPAVAAVVGGPVLGAAVGALVRAGWQKSRPESAENGSLLCSVTGSRTGCGRELKGPTLKLLVANDKWKRSKRDRSRVGQPAI